jgi:hypothetical protein
MAHRTDLSRKMHALADTGHARADDLRTLGKAFDQATAAQDGTRDGAKRMLGAWARARRLWSDTTGEPLI